MNFITTNIDRLGWTSEDIHVTQQGYSGIFVEEQASREISE